MSKQRPPKNIIQKIDHAIARFEAVALMVALGGMTLMTFIQVLLRNLFSSGILWLEPVVRHLLLVAVFVGGSLATYEHHHIHIDTIAKILKGQVRHLTYFLTSLAASFICFVLLYGGVEFVRSSYASGDRIHEVFPTWIAQLVMPYGFCIIGLRFFRDAILYIDRFRRRVPVDLELPRVNVATTDDSGSSGETPL